MIDNTAFDGCGWSWCKLGSEEELKEEEIEWIVRFTRRYLLHHHHSYASSHTHTHTQAHMLNNTNIHIHWDLILIWVLEGVWGEILIIFFTVSMYLYHPPLTCFAFLSAPLPPPLLLLSLPVPNSRSLPSFLLLLPSLSLLPPFHPSHCTLSDIAGKENCIVTPAEIKEQLDVLVVQVRTEPARYVTHFFLVISPTFFNLTFTCWIS